MSCINLCCGEKNGIEKHFETVENGSMLSQSFQKSANAGSSGSGGFSCGAETGNAIGLSATVMDGQTRNPLLCFVCDNYYNDPCLLICYHTFCAKCLHGREADRKISCPLCGVQTVLKDGQAHPAQDMLMRHMIELANAENPPCANCDKRDKNNMYFCITCGQALCTSCRENTHRAKMFSAHEVVHMSKCSKDSYRKQCTQHGEQHVMFSNSQRSMLCDSCFQDVPTESKVHCVDIDTAYNQSCKKLERAISTVQNMQSSVRDGLLMFKNLLDELRRNMETEKVTINSFCEGMRQAIAKTQASMMMEIQRQFESKERLFHGQLTNLGSMLPLLQLHLLLAQTFSISANKYQFLDLAYPMMDRLNAVSQLSLPLSRPVQSSQIRTNFRSEFSRSLEPWIGVQSLEGGRPKSGMSIYESQKQQQQQHQQQQQQQQQQKQQQQQQQSHLQYLTQQQQQQQIQPLQPLPQQQQQSFQMQQPTPSRHQQSSILFKGSEESGPFTNHCRNFDSQLKDLSAQLGGVKKKLGELTTDVTLLRRAHTPPLTLRFETVTRDCNALGQALECRQLELERLQGVFHTLWEQQLCRVQTEREIFEAQISDVMTLVSEVKNITNAARQLEPYVVALSAADIAISQMHQQAQSAATQQQVHPKPSVEDASHLQSVLEHINYLQQTERLRKDPEVGKGECRVHPGASPGHASSTTPQDKLLYIKLEGKGKSSRVKSPRDRSEQREAQEQQQLIAQAMLESGYGTTGGRESKRGSVLSHIMGKVRTKEERKKSPEEPCRAKTPTRERVKSEGRGDSSHIKSERQLEGKPKTKGKVASLYHSLSGKVMGSSHSIQTVIAAEDEQQMQQQQSRRHLPPPPPPQRRPTTQITSIHRDDSSPIDIPPDGTVKRRGRLSRPASAGEKEETDYPITRKAKSVGSPTDFGGHLVRAVIHKDSTGNQPVSPRRHRSTESALRQVRMYPASDTEESVFKQSSCESLALSDIGLSGDHRKTLIVVVGSKSKRLMHKQRSWETFPPKRRDGHRSRFCQDPAAFRSGFENGSPVGSTMSHIGPTLKKADSFEGHEEAVRTLVAAVQQHQHHQQHQQNQQNQAMQQQHHQRKHSGPKAQPPSG